MRADNHGTVVAVQNWIANDAIYQPFVIPWPYPVNRVWWTNGSTLTSSHADFGIYTPQGGKIYSTGSTVMSGTSAIQYVTPATPFILDPGAYYFAFWCDNSTSRVSGVAASATTASVLGFLTQASLSSALPASATFASISTNAVPITLCGITRTISGF